VDEVKLKSLEKLLQTNEGKFMERNIFRVSMHTPELVEYVNVKCGNLYQSLN